MQNLNRIFYFDFMLKSFLIWNIIEYNIIKGTNLWCRYLIRFSLAEGYCHKEIKLYLTLYTQVSLKHVIGCLCLNCITNNNLSYFKCKKCVKS